MQNSRRQSQQFLFSCSDYGSCGYFFLNIPLSSFGGGVDLVKLSAIPAVVAISRNKIILPLILLALVVLFY